MLNIKDFINESMAPKSMIAGEGDNNVIVPVIWTLRTHGAGRDDVSDILKSVNKTFKQKFAPNWDGSPVYHIIDYMHPDDSAYFGTPNETLRNGDYERQVIIIDTDDEWMGHLNKLLKKNDLDWWVKETFLFEMKKMYGDILSKTLGVYLTKKHSEMESALKKCGIKYDILK